VRNCNNTNLSFASCSPKMLQSLLTRGLDMNEQEGSMVGSLFPPSSNESPVAFDDGASVMRYVIPVSTIKGNGTSTYEPLSSVWEGSDGVLLEEIFGF
jgi:hypothetical protein